MVAERLQVRAALPSRSHDAFSVTSGEAHTNRRAPAPNRPSFAGPDPRLLLQSHRSSECPCSTRLVSAVQGKISPSDELTNVCLTVRTDSHNEAIEKLATS